MYVIICIRTAANGKTVAIPIMETDDEGEETGSMALYTYDEACEAELNHPFVSASEHIIIDIENIEIL